MKFFDINRDPTKWQLRQFGCCCLVAFPLIAWLWGGSMATIRICAVAGMGCAIVSFLAPKVLSPVFVAVGVATMPIGLVVSEVATLLIYYMMFVPLGLIFRVIGRDALNCEIDRDRESYWESRQQPDDVADYYRQS